MQWVLVRRATQRLKRSRRICRRFWSSPCGARSDRRDVLARLPRLRDERAEGIPDEEKPQRHHPGSMQAQCVGNGLLEFEGRNDHREVGELVPRAEGIALRWWWRGRGRNVAILVSHCARRSYRLALALSCRAVADVPRKFLIAHHSSSPGMRRATGGFNTASASNQTGRARRPATHTPRMCGVITD